MKATKDAEKEYLTRTGGGAWELAKPFSHREADTAIESAELLHDFALAILTLRPGPQDLILDLGAGGCWCSDLLQRLNRRSVAVDISLEMLATGRQRANGETLLAVVGDMERLPFRAGVFSKAVSLNAIHHVPDIGAAVVEIARVLDRDGIAYFSEPGVGHSTSPSSMAAVRDFGVLEQDIIIAEFAVACRSAGFRHVLLKPLSYAAPEFELTPEEFNSWARLARSKRPLRALGKMLRAAAELFGIGKRSVLFEEAFAMRLVRKLRPLVEEHPVIVASKSEPAESTVYAAEVSFLQLPNRVASGDTVEAHVRVTNLGNQTWRVESRTGVGHVRIGLQLIDSSGKVLAKDFARGSLPRDIASGESVETSVTFDSPLKAGSYRIKIDLVAEGVTWFETAGSAPATKDLIVIDR